MFVERSESRIRSARTAFLVLCLLPCAGLVAWAVYWNGKSYRAASVRSWGREIGLDVACDHVEHLRPGAVRLTNCRITTRDGRAAAAFKVVEIENAAEEVRVHVPQFDATLPAIRAVCVAARSWLDEPATHGKAWLVDVGAVGWKEGIAKTGRSVSGRSSDPSDLGGIRIECVATGGRRGIRVRRQPATEDEIRVIRTSGEAGAVLVVEARIDASIPLGIASGMLGNADTAPLGWCSGTLSAERANGLWSGSVSGLIDKLDAASIPRIFGSPFLLGGDGRIEVSKAVFSESAITDAAATVAITSGIVSQELLDRLVQVAQCRPGAAYRTDGLEAVVSSPRSFDEAVFRLRVDTAGLAIRAADRRAGALMVSAGRSLLDEPAGVIPCESIVWAFAAPDARAVPATATTAWLIPLLPARESRRPQ